MTEIDRGKEGQAPAQAIAAMIRQSSEAGQLFSESEILRWVADQHLLPLPSADSAEGFRNILKNLVEGSEDLHYLAAPDGSRSYYSSNFMTEAYAQILLRKQGDRLRLIAEVVRENSALYPRPVPLDIFTHPPFEFTPKEVLDDLERMKGEAEYRDIAPTKTSTSRVLLYSTLYLEPDHASMLGEWFDVGQFNNP